MNHRDPVQRYKVYRGEAGLAGYSGWLVVALLAVWAAFVLARTPGALSFTALFLLPSVVLALFARLIYRRACGRKGKPENRAYARALVVGVFYPGLFLGWHLVTLVLAGPGEKGPDFAGVLMLAGIAAAVLIFLAVSEGRRNR